VLRFVCESCVVPSYQNSTSLQTRISLLIRLHKNTFVPAAGYFIEDTQIMLETTKKLLIFDDIHLLSDGKNYVMPFAMNCLWKELCRYFHSVSLCAPTIDVESLEDPVNIKITADNLYYIKRPYYESPAAFFKKFWRIIPKSIPIIQQAIKECDIILIRLPTVWSPIVYCLAKHYKKNIVIHIKGSWSGTVQRMKEDRFSATSYVEKTIASIYEQFHCFLAGNNPSLVMSTQEVSKYKKTNLHVQRIEVSLISEKNIFKREDTCKNETIKLLFVGRLAPSKGLNYLIDAMYSLQSKHSAYKYELYAAGEGPLKNDLMSSIDSYGLHNIHLTGTLSPTTGLTDLYRNCDIFILPSLSEGVPKVLYEALAANLPIIITSVGGIPEIVHHNREALLITPGSTEEIINAIELIAENPALRHSLLLNGHKLIKNYSVEGTAWKMADFIMNNLV